MPKPWELSGVEKQLARQDDERLKALLKRDELEVQLALVESSNPEHLPERIAEDQRYAVLKTQYETAVMAGATGKDAEMGGNPSVVDAREALQAWVEKICLPELKQEYQNATVECDIAEQRKRDLQKIVDELQARIHDIDGQLPQQARPGF